MKGSILTIGKEILIGQTIDTNAAWLGSQLEEIGAEVYEIRSVADEEPVILKNLEEMFVNSDLVIVTGGLGPTNDDVTKKVVAEFLDLKLAHDQELFDRISKIFKLKNLKVTDAIKKQCLMPIGMEKIPNEMGTAPGMWYFKNGKGLLSMPGVPFEMKWIFTNNIIDKIKENYFLENILHKTIMTAGVGESNIAEQIKNIEKGLPSHIDLAFLPSISQVKLRLSGKSNNQALLKEEINSITNDITSELNSVIYGYDNLKLEQALQKMCIEKGVKLAVAESCTGGMLSHKITLIPHCSAYFIGGYTVYSNELKHKLLGVNLETLDKFGAVSEETVIEMLKGTIKNTGADISVAISGVAGPTGGTYNKPVGTVWMAYGSLDDIRTKRLNLTKDRALNIEYSVNYALNALRKFLLQR